MDRLNPQEKRRAVDAVRQVCLPPGVAVRPWREEDFTAVQRLSAAEGWSTPTERPAEALRAWQVSWPALVAVADDEIVGFVRAVSDGVVTTYVCELLVVPEWRKRNIGAALLAVTQALLPGTRLDLLSTGTSDRFYQRMGFRQFAGYRRSRAEFPDPSGEQ